MILNYKTFGKQILGSSLSLPAYGREGQGQHSLAAHFAKQNTKNCGGGKRGRGGNSFSPHPFFFPPRPSGKVFCSAARSVTIKNQHRDFVQKKFGFCPKGTANLQFQRF